MKARRRWVLTAALATVIVLLPAVALFWAAERSRDAVEQQVRSAQMTLALSAVTRVTDLDDAAEQRIRSAATSPGLRHFLDGGDRRSAAAVLESIAGSGDYRSVRVETDGGVSLRWPAGPTAEDAPATSRDGYALVNDEAVRTVAVPLSDDHPGTELVAEISLARLLPNLAELQFGRSGVISVVDRQGYLLRSGSTSPGRQLQGKVALDLAVNARAGTASTYSPRLERDVVLAFAPARSGAWGVFASVSQQEAFEDADALVWRLRAAGAFALVLAIGLAVAISVTRRRAGRSLRKAHAATSAALLDAEEANARVLRDMAAVRAAEREARAAHEALRYSTVRLERSEAQFRAAFERGPMPMCRLDGSGLVVQANPALRRLLALPTSLVVGQSLIGLVVPSDRERLSVALAAARSSDLEVDLVEVRMARPNGSSVWCEVAVTGGEDADGTPYLLVQFADVDARKRREADLERLAAHDDLTGLPNRAALAHRLTEYLAPDALSQPVGLLFIDLDGFKQVNDTVGHQAGDEVLVEVARRLQQTVRADDLVVRLGGDEFVVLCAGRDADAERRMRVLGDRLTRALEPPIATSAGTCRIGASVGVTMAAPGEDPRAVLRRADAAMYSTKARRKARASAPDVLPASAAPQPRLADLIRTADREGRLDVVYQPVVELASGRTVGVEALLRMRNREGRIVLPDAFIPAAEATGDIHALGEWVLRRACEQTAVWKRMLPAGQDFALGVNLSPRQLDDPGLLDRVDAALRDADLDPASLVLELTERLLTADTPAVRRALQGVRDRGVHLACDDFGTGYASLRYLHDLPVDTIKIDRSWASRLVAGGDAAKLARGVFRLAQATDLVVLAEGIETEVERRAVLAQGCSLGQGYLFSRPVPAAEVTARLTDLRLAG